MKSPIISPFEDQRKKVAKLLNFDGEYVPNGSIGIPHLAIVLDCLEPEELQNLGITKIQQIPQSILEIGVKNPFQDATLKSVICKAYTGTGWGLVTTDFGWQVTGITNTDFIVTRTLQQLYAKYNQEPHWDAILTSVNSPDMDLTNFTKSIILKRMRGICNYIAPEQNFYIRTPVTGEMINLVLFENPAENYEGLLRNAALELVLRPLDSSTEDWTKEITPMYIPLVAGI